MTLAELLSQVVLPALAAASAGLGAGIVYARRRAPGASGRPPPPADPRALDVPRAERPTELRDSQPDLGRLLRCDRHQDLEDTVAELAAAARETRATTGLRLDAIDARLDAQHTVLAEVRDTVVRMEAQANGRPLRAPVLRGGAAR